MVVSSSNDSTQFFEDDDADTLDLLVSSAAADDMKTYLGGLVSRFRDDSNGPLDEKFWNSLSKSAEELGFRTSGTWASSPRTVGGSTSFPAAFQTDSGQKHIRATTSLLRISETRAVQLTLSALRSLNGGEDARKTHIQSLLGTCELLRTVRDHHFQQRVARLQVIAECVRIEQDESSPHYDAAIQMLDDLDKNFVMDGRLRGLFRRLLTVACAPYTSPSREELLPLVDLRSESPESLQSAELQASGASGFVASDIFVANCIQATRVQAHHEREEAMEAILVLLYNRIDQGIHRVDYALLLLAFQSCSVFFTTEGKRLGHLSSLVCAESMSLWLTTSTEEDNNGNLLWLFRHPMLVGVLESDARAVQEIEAVRMLLMKYASQVPGRRRLGVASRTVGKTLGGESAIDAPESIALLSFALLLRLVDMNTGRLTEVIGQSYNFETHAIECAEFANDECGAFDYLYATMVALVRTPVKDSFSSVKDPPYDWQLSDQDTPFLLEGRNVQEDGLSAATVAYTSIGLEILTSTIVAFQSTIRIGNTISMENVSMLCSLAAIIYGNRPVLCDGFWPELALYQCTSLTPSQECHVTSKNALCYLTDACYVGAASALNAAFAAQDQPGVEESLLPSLVPLLQLMSSLCSNYEMVEAVLKLLPKGLIRTALLCCSSSGRVADMTAFSKNVLHVLESVQCLARIGSSRSCRAMLRCALEEDDTDFVDGPRMLYSIIAKYENASIVGSALRIMGYFVERAAGQELWIAKAAKYVGPSGLGNNGLSAILTGQSYRVVLAGLHVLSGFIRNMTTVAFCPLCEETDVLDLLDVVVSGIRAGCMLLSSLLSSTSKYPLVPEKSSYLIAHGVLRCLAMFLREVRLIKNIHASLRVRSASLEARDILIQTLATSTSVGEAISYFAAAPVSLSLAIALEDALRHSQVLQLASDEHAREEEPKGFGLWRSVMHSSRENEPAINRATVKVHAQHLVSNIHELDIGLQDLQARRLTTEHCALEPLQAASAALDLLRLWAVHVDEIVAEKHGVDGGNATSLSQAAASELRALSPYRLILCQVAMPPAVAESIPLSKVWPADRLSLIDLLIRYLQGGVEDQNGNSSDEKIPTLLAADVLSLSLVHAKQSGQTIHIPAAETLVRSAAELSGVLLQSIANVVGLVSTTEPKGHLTVGEDTQLRYGLASLRLLRICVDLDPRVVMAVFGPENSALLDEITGFINGMASSLCDTTSFDQISLDAVSTSQMRVTSACIDVLLSLWQSSCTLSKPDANRISAIVDAIKKNVVADLISIVTQFTRLLPKEVLAHSPKSVHLTTILLAGTSKALDVLLVELSRLLKETNATNEGTRMMISEMMRASFPSLSERLSRIDGAVGVARCWASFEAFFESFKYIGVRDPLPILSSFPAVYTSEMETFQIQDNLCDTAATMGWLSSLHQTADTSHAGDLLKSANAYCLLLSNQLKLVSSWGQFALMFSSSEEHAGNLLNRDDSRRKTLSMARTVLTDLGRMAMDMEEAQIVVSEDFLTHDGGSSAYVLAGLLLETMSKHFLDVRASGGKSPMGAERAALIDMLGQLKDTMEKLASATYPIQPSAPFPSLAVTTYPARLGQSAEKLQEDTLYTSCALQKRLLAVAIVCITTLDQICPSTKPSVPFQPDPENQLADVLLDFVGVACKVLGLVDVLSKQARRTTPPSMRISNLSGELLETCVALLTLLLSRERGSRISVIGENLYYSNAAASMKRFDIIESLVTHVNVASKAALPSPPVNNRMEGAPFFSANEDDVRTVQSIFTFLRTVAEVGQNSKDILSLISSSALSRMIVDNQLLIAANQHWVSQTYADGQSCEKASLTMRGYLPIKGKMPAGISIGESKTIVAGPFLSGRDDPVHSVWRTALQILQTVIHAYSEPRTEMDGNRHFLSTAVAFLNTHYASLTCCLNRCSLLKFENQRGSLPAMRVAHAVLTFNVLCETSDILSLVSSLCSGIHLHHFQSVCTDIYCGLTQASHTVLEGLSKFLAAAGTATETFTAIKEYELQESVNREQGDFRYGFNENDIHPLLASGIPNARHEAIKHAHYASRCCAYVTAVDYEGLPSMSENAVDGAVSTSTLEEDSQRSMNSPFILRMEYAAAECVSHAISVLSETHPASSCFVMFSPDEVRRVDTLSLLTTGMLLAVRPETGGISRFCRILHVDTVHRLCHVRYVGASDDRTEGTVSVDAVVGVEDMTKRRPVLAYSAAPVSAAELDSAAAMVGPTASLGDVIITLRWCYQCAGQLGMDSSEKNKSIRKVLAENASMLLCTEISLHGEIGTASFKSGTKEKELSTRVLAQLLHLFDDSNEAAKWDAKLKTIVTPSMWNAIQQQLENELSQARKDRKEKKARIAERAAEVYISSPWFKSWP